jgi:anti-anti-sigma factor
MTVRDAAVVLALHGDLDLFAEASLRARLQTLDGARCAIVDLSAVSYLDSVALNAFVRVVKAFAARRARVVWVAPPASIARRLFTLAMLERYVEIADDLASARQALAAT